MHARLRLLTEELVDKTAPNRDTDGVLAQLLESTRQFKQREELILDFTPDLVISLDENLVALALNHTWQRMTGHAPALSSGSTMDKFMREEQFTAFHSTATLARRNNVPASGDSDLLTAEGRTFPVFWTVEWSRELNQYFCVGQDVTKERMISRLKAEQAGLLSHDLKVPLASLQITLSRLSRGEHGDLDDQGRMSIEDSLLCTAQLNRLVDNLMTLHKSEEGHLNLSLKMVPIATILEQSIAMVRSLAEEKSLGLSLSAKSGEELISWCDKDACVQIFVNLLSNAIKYSPRSRQIVVSATNLDSFIEVLVEDNGPGVPDRCKTEVFERYKQAIPTRETEKSGTGLGLAVCKSLAEAQNGHIGVRDRPGGGSAFYVQLRSATAEEVG